MAQTKKRPMRSTATVLSELRQLHAEMNALRKEFQSVHKRAKELIKRSHANSDTAKLASIRKKLGL